MPNPLTEGTAPRKTLRLWPGVAVAVLLVLVKLVAPLVADDGATLALMGGMLGGVLIALWWLFFSRAAWSERGAVLAVMAVGLAATRPMLHESIRGGMMGMLFFVYALPVLGLALVAWAVASRHLAAGPRRASMAATLLLACGAFTLLRTGGISGAGSDFHWRWTATPEERLLAQAADEPAAVPPSPAAVTPANEPLPTGAAGEPAPLPSAPPAAATPKERVRVPSTAEPSSSPAAPGGTGSPWPGFRGPARDGVIRGVRIGTDWSASPPVVLWRRPIGPAWSSFAVHGAHFYTQEQRGDDEVVACYKVATGEPVWRHRDAARFYESNAGAGPRGTPTLVNGRLYTLGATGIVNALDAGTGAVVWSRNAASDTGTKIPGWGFAASPLVVGDLLVVATAGDLVAYDLATGSPRWSRKGGGGGYSSPHLATIGGTSQVLLLHGAGATSVAPADGTVLWEHAWPGDGIVQPALTPDGDVLLGSGSGMGSGVGVRRLAVARGDAGWTVQERWTSNGLKPYFNDFVVHDGHAFGFDGRLLSCIDLKDGARKWKGGRYGNGQLVALSDQGLLVVLSEEGELALVGAGPGEFKELARFPAIEGKTWNHPVLVGDVLLARNGQEMAAFRLPPAVR